MVASTVMFPEFEERDVMLLILTLLGFRTVESTDVARVHSSDSEAVSSSGVLLHLNPKTPALKWPCDCDRLLISLLF